MFVKKNLTVNFLCAKTPSQAVIDQGLWESVHYYKRQHWRVSFDRLRTLRNFDACVDCDFFALFNLIPITHVAVWKNQLMGWSSNADPLGALHEKLKFETKEDAIKFCVSQGAVLYSRVYF